MANIELGVGLIGIGREWGHAVTPVPSETEAQRFLETAFGLGITYFDTAPSYGWSELRLKKFINGLKPDQRKSITIATKFGEHWNSNTQEAYTDHSYDALVASIDKSLDRLGRVDILQLHKTNPDVLRSNDLIRAMDYARASGISTFGASVSDEESGRMVAEDSRFSVIQLPFNRSNQALKEIVDLVQDHGKLVVVNRPFNMGEILHSAGRQLSLDEQRVDSYRFIAENISARGIILTGTKSPQHLRENIYSFQEAIR